MDFLQDLGQVSWLIYGNQVFIQEFVEGDLLYIHEACSYIISLDSAMKQLVEGVEQIWQRDQQGTNSMSESRSHTSFSASRKNSQDSSSSNNAAGAGKLVNKSAQSRNHSVSASASPMTGLRRTKTTKIDKQGCSERKPSINNATLLLDSDTQIAANGCYVSAFPQGNNSQQ